MEVIVDSEFSEVSHEYVYVIYCGVCGADIESFEWQYCPLCGEEIEMTEEAKRVFGEE